MIGYYIHCVQDFLLTILRFFEPACNVVRGDILAKLQVENPTKPTETRKPTQRYKIKKKNCFDKSNKNKNRAPSAEIRHQRDEIPIDPANKIKKKRKKAKQKEIEHKK